MVFKEEVTVSPHVTESVNIVSSCVFIRAQLYFTLLQQDAKQTEASSSSSPNLNAQRKYRLSAPGLS